MTPPKEPSNSPEIDPNLKIIYEMPENEFKIIIESKMHEKR